MSLPPPWEPHVTDEGARYYYNPDSGDFVWSKNLPAGGAGAPSAFESDSSAPVPDADVIGEWALYYDSTGNGYYSNSATGESKWAQPDDWVMYYDNTHGAPYYWNTVTGDSVWASATEDAGKQQQRTRGSTRTVRFERHPDGGRMPAGRGGRRGGGAVGRRAVESSSESDTDDTTASSDSDRDDDSDIESCRQRRSSRTHRRGRKPSAARKLADNLDAADGQPALLPLIAAWAMVFLTRAIAAGKVAAVSVAALAAEAGRRIGGLALHTVAVAGDGIGAAATRAGPVLDGFIAKMDDVVGVGIAVAETVSASPGSPTSSTNPAPVTSPPEARVKGTPITIPAPSVRAGSSTTPAPPTRATTAGGRLPPPRPPNAPPPPGKPFITLVSSSSAPTHAPPNVPPLPSPLPLSPPFSSPNSRAHSVVVRSGKPATVGNGSDEPQPAIARLHSADVETSVTASPAVAPTSVGGVISSNVDPLTYLSPTSAGISPADPRLRIVDEDITGLSPQVEPADIAPYLPMVLPSGDATQPQFTSTAPLPLTQDDIDSPTHPPPPLPPPLTPVSPPQMESP